MHMRVLCVSVRVSPSDFAGSSYFVRVCCAYMCVGAPVCLCLCHFFVGSQFIYSCWSSGHCVTAARWLVGLSDQSVGPVTVSQLPNLSLRF